MIYWGRQAAGDMKWVKAVHFTHAAPSYRDEYDRIFRVPVTFWSDKNAFMLEDSFLSFKPPPAPAYTSQVLRSHAEEQLEKLEKSKTIRSCTVVISGRPGLG